MTHRMQHPLKAFTLIVLGLALGAMGIYVGEVDDAPGAGGLGLILMAAGVTLGIKAARGRMPVWAARTAIVVGAVLAVLAALMTRGVALSRPLFAQAQSVPSAHSSSPLPQYDAAVEKGRELVRAAMLQQKLPGVSVAVGADGHLVWAEGFGWRDVETRTPVTPETRFNIGTAAAAVIPSVGPLGLAHTGADEAAEWSPAHVGEPEEDPPPFTIIRRLVFVPLGLAAPPAPLPGERATFYRPRAEKNPRSGQAPMYMRHLACCANGKAFSSTPSDLVQFALAKNPNSLNGELGGGMVMSLVSGQRGVVVAVTTNISYAKTSELAERVSDAFAGVVNRPQ